jgi:hypothetical protein
MLSAGPPARRLCNLCFGFSLDELIPDEETGKRLKSAHGRCSVVLKAFDASQALR